MPCHAAPLSFSDSAVFFVEVSVVAGNILTASPTVLRIGMLLITIFVELRVVAGKSRTASPTVLRVGMLLITIFVELRVVAGRSRTRVGRPHAVYGRPILIHIYHAAPKPRCAVAWRSSF
jgi:hypothetical protein